jgi:RimJ/RimL family protein N-acetyltransferase
VSDEAADLAQMLISGQRAALGVLREDLLPVYQRWMNDREVAMGLGHFQAFTTGSIRSLYESSFRSDPRQVRFTVYDRQDLAPVGVTALTDVDHQRAIARFGILLGERRGQRIGTEAIQLTVEWGFIVLGLFNIELAVSAWNSGAIRAYTKAGFREIGRRRGASVCMGRRFDEVYMDVTADEFSGSALSHLVVKSGRPLY